MMTSQLSDACTSFQEEKHAQSPFLNPRRRSEGLPARRSKTSSTYAGTPMLPARPRKRARRLPSFSLRNQQLKLLLRARRNNYVPSFTYTLSQHPIQPFLTRPPPLLQIT